MLKKFLKAACLATVLGFLPATASAQVNSFVVNQRVFNDLPDSTLTVTNVNNTLSGGSVTIRDEFGADTTGVNRHDVALSANGGASAFLFSNQTPFTITMNMRLNSASNSPRKEAGFRINDAPALPGTGDFLYIVNSGPPAASAEIVAFGGPFFNFRNPDGFNEAPYALNETVFMGMTYRPATLPTAATIEYFFQRAGGPLRTSGQLPFTNTENGPANDFQVALYVQGGAANSDDFMEVAFSNIQATSGVPEPTSLGLLGVGALGLLARRRKVA